MPRTISHDSTLVSIEREREKCWVTARSEKPHLGASQPSTFTQDNVPNYANGNASTLGGIWVVFRMQICELLGAASQKAPTLRLSSGHSTRERRSDTIPAERVICLLGGMWRVRMQSVDHRDDFAARIIRIVAAQDDQIDARKITLETRLKEDLEFDSLAALTLIFALEEDFDINITDDDARGLMTVGDIVARLHMLCSKAPRNLRVRS